MPPYGLYSLANTPEELLSRGYGYASNIPMMDLSEAERNILFTQNDPAFGNLNTDVGYFGAPFTGERPFQNALFLRGDRQYGLGFDGDIDNPSFGGVSGYRNTGGIMDIQPNVKSVMNNIDFGTSEDNFQGFTDKEDFSESKTKGGIADFFRTILGFAIPGGNFFLNKGRNAMDGIRSLNQRLRNTDFGQSKTLVDYFDRKKRRRETDFLGSDDPQGDIITYSPAKTRNRQRIMNMQPTSQDIARGGGSIPTRTTSAPRRSSSTYSDAKSAFTSGR